MEIKIKIPDNKFDRFKEAFYKIYPKPKDYGSKTDLEYIELWIYEQLFKVYKTGEIRIAQDKTPQDIDLEIFVEGV